ncbi:MBL fold metallo-hydrolase [Kribbella deserti]|uniref:MBL fold metallo-hydrolase n=1 Tax=Kribbella deserti TaxID=1926257 RepID=A0ABV6QHV1_9ACTN
MTAEVVTARATRLLAANPGPMTLEGTNTWILREPGASSVVVVDPGPLLEPHLAAILDHVESLGCRIETVLLTHGHYDHSEGAAWFAAHAGCSIRSVDPMFHVPPGAPDDGLADGEVLEADGLRLEVLTTPGHTADSVCFYLPDEGSLLTGDTVLGRGTSVVAHPDGTLAPYLDSLNRLQALPDVHLLLPGHGPVVDNPADVLAYYLQHRAERLDQVRAAVAAGATTPAEVVQAVYAEVPPILWPAAERSVRAQLDYLSTHPNPNPA